MLKIGITGGIGSGKTTVCKFFELQRIPVFYADQQAKSIMHTDGLLVDQISREFGADIYFSNGELNRSKLGALVFNDEEKLKKLNSIVHPAVFRAFDNWLNQQKNAPYVLKEAALLFESGSYKDCDFNLLITSPHNLKISRIMQRDSVSEGEVLKRMNKQLSDAEKAPLSDFTINNDEKQLLIPQMLDLHNHFINLSLSVK
ncbi:dephospho-CoA kinase [Paradesertivirga mongoliensis]|uniref:Dephospho-CoA kinase n=1 Tax=Paradesertivirga mongoliensis TaxID=2100740 RepID=A0ABW4ZLA5_9SPHI|nr:dephospho-CoA kinase [Pedobacter mongoliensis]